jgi:hypothetical protein
MGATKIMVIRHAERPDKYHGKAYSGVDATGTTRGAQGKESLVTIGWQRTGALVALFAPPWGPRTPTLAQPQHLYAADPDTSDAGRTPSLRPYETLTALEAMLALKINKKHKKKDYADMVTDALGKDGVVLIAWQHEDIPLLTAQRDPGISQCILTGTGTDGTLGVPASWPNDRNGKARYDLVWVFDRPSGAGPIVKFTQFAQMLLPGDEPAPASRPRAG